MVWAWLRRSKRSPKPKYLLSSATANLHSAAVRDSAVTSVTPGESCRTWGAVAGARPSTRKRSRVILSLRPSVVGKAKRTSPARVAGTATRNRISVVDRSMALSTDHASIMSVIPSRLAAPLSLALLAACRTSAPPAAIDPALSGRVPAATVALAGVDLDRLRASPLYARLPPAALAFLAPFAHAHRVLIASNGVELLTIARGVVPGATQIAPDVALSGAPSLVDAAIGAHPAAGILVPAESVAAGPVWIAVRGGVALPLEGNLANVNNLLRGAEYVTLALDPGDPADLQLVARCPTPEAALHFEQSFRALISLAAATNTRQPATAAMLQSIRIVREDRVVRVSLSAPLETLVRLVL